MVGAVTVVAGTEGTAHAYKIVARLHAFNGLEHITCTVPCLNAYNRAVLCLGVGHFTISIAPSTSPVFRVLLCKVAIGN